MLSDTADELAAAVASPANWPNTAPMMTVDEARAKWREVFEAMTRDWLDTGADADARGLPDPEFVYDANGRNVGIKYARRVE